MMMTKEEEDVGGMVWVWQRTVMEINEPELTESVWRLCMRELNEFHVGFFSNDKKMQIRVHTK